MIGLGIFLVVGEVLTMVYIVMIYSSLAPGSYPICFFAMPVFVFLGLIGLGFLEILRLCGVRIGRER